MAGEILIIDAVATNRIVLKVKLLVAQYRVRLCETLAEAKAEIDASLPDLILLDTAIGKDAVSAFCTALNADERASLIPIIATGGFTTPKDRVAALEAGADDVLSKPFDDHILQARIRSLLRSRDARQELRMRDGTRTALGFAEACSEFTAPTQLLVASLDDTLAPDLGYLSQTLENVQVNTSAPESITREPIKKFPIDLFLLDFRAGLSDDKVLFRILSELRSRSETRHSSIMALLPTNARHAAAMALDLGANDIVYSTVAAEEIRHRCAVLIQAKHEADALRRTVESGLEAAITDPLTGLFNRRYALPHLSRLSTESRKNGRQFAIMALDLDHFKTVNDTYGHAAGDEVLRQTAARLQGNLRAVDLLARMGGEEFLVAIPNSDVVHARKAAERLCDLIGGAPFYVGPDRQEVNVTMSVGVYLSDGTDAGEKIESHGALVNAADVALYAAKSGGRNKVSLSAA
ncbi:diguanylate cyclase [Octadecabacter ascidiaceicola]|uniref:diguanylate cyclase n=1 Tax=Octadecabacter ascidiaceicola TaxID=1655543 RepID=A0A238K311_9RHOB|nr:diguanylate cyclase [Octadecabacter ascidiaceicola]SMX37280.1 Response regulator PleD [Octadecabacter ascidiaceicola]